MPNACPIHRPYTGTPQFRPTTAERGYGGEWHKIRAEQLSLAPYCCQCRQPASHVDHIRPLKCGGTNDSNNLQSLCASCHSRKTASVDGGFGNNRQQE